MIAQDVMRCFSENTTEKTIPLNIVYKTDFDIWVKNQTEFSKNWIKNSGFKASANRFLIIPDNTGCIDSVLVIADSKNIIWCLGKCANELPEGDYSIATNLSESEKESCALGWGLGSYDYKRYKKKNKKNCTLVLDVENKTKVESLLSGITVTRDMVNTPASDMMPQNISDTCKSIGKNYDVNFSECVGKELLSNNFPVIHAVGRASVHHPRLIEFSWGESNKPTVALIGKGVSFDSGGLNIKSAQGMRLMKKDMGGAAHVAGIATAIMQMNLPIQLKVLIPAVENAISGNAYRPGDVLTARNGKTIEIDNTDAEGRLILCDALSKAIEDEPDIIIDFATLTGAARVAMGTEIPAFFCNDQTLADALKDAADDVCDPIWQLPLHTPYRYMLDSSVADFTNSATSGFGGAITAALFLKEFVPDTIKWAHFDVMAWNNRSRPGRPKGGEAMGLRAVVEFLQREYAH